MKKCSYIHVIKYHEHADNKNMGFNSYFDYIEIKNELPELQKLVNGLIEPLTLVKFNVGNKSYAIDIVCNDEGKLLELDFNAVLVYNVNQLLYDFIAGNYFFALADLSSGEYVDLPPVYVSKIKNAIGYNKALFPVDDRTLPVIFVEDLMRYFSGENIL